MADWEGIIVRVPGTCGGQPIIKGTRMPVWLLLEFQACGATEDELLEITPTCPVKASEPLMLTPKPTAWLPTRTGVPSSALTTTLTGR